MGEGVSIVAGSELGLEGQAGEERVSSLRLGSASPGLPRPEAPGGPETQKRKERLQPCPKGTGAVAVSTQEEKSILREKKGKYPI